MDLWDVQIISFYFHLHFTHHLNLKTICYLCCIIYVLSTHVAVQTEATRDKLSAAAALVPFYPPLMS